MPQKNDKVYQPADLSAYSLTQRSMIRLASLTFFAAIKLIGSTIRFEVRGMEHLEAIKQAGKTPIYTFWHDRIFLSTYFWRHYGLVAMISKSFDGEYIARSIQRFGYGAIRGSSSRGGAKALIEMIRAMRGGLPMAFTADGPRGPKYEAKPGPVILAKKTGNPMLPFIIEPKRCWRANSWDKMHIPTPFTSALTLIGEPIYVDPKADDSEVESKLAELQRSLANLVEEGRKWRESR